ncbi:hypothetical protein [Candidatus Pelagibacter sp.]|jgi:hypothetical protein|uniref:hypothetical protein n=1 Tax=Candidatus Pelagibacter sp. TaxID=2024849 RepID=UPI003F83B1A8|tara:strand:- start:393 stop:650 length:258 start_codon:yes stop_codon:yes gene_type:complete
MKLNKDDMIKILRVLENNTNTMLEMEEQNFENNKKYMRLQQQLFHEQWKNRYLVRRIKNVAKLIGDPNIAVTEEELDEQIKGSEN